MRKSIQWSEKEDELILENFALIKSKKWKMISNLLKEQGFEKKETQCRERYINHLAPSLDKNKQISADQLQLFYQKYEQYGPKWTLIQRFLPKKSQVQLKNIFYGNIRCFVKKIIKYFTNKTAVFVNRLDTFTLQNAYSGKRNFRGLTFLKEDIKKMHYRFDEDLCFSLIEAREQNYMTLFKVLLQQDETKKSKHYEYFKKINTKKTLSSNEILNGSQIQNEESEEDVLQDEVKQEMEKVNHALSQISQKNQFNVDPTPTPVPNYYWNKNQYFFLNQQPYGFPLNYDQVNFYQPQTNYSFQSFMGRPVFMNGRRYDNISYSNAL